MIKYDSYNCSVLVVMSWGAVLQMSFDVMSVTAGNVSEDDDDDYDEDKEVFSGAMFVNTYHAYYLMDTLELHIDPLLAHDRKLENVKVGNLN